MKRLFVLGMSILAALFLVAGCANPLVGSDGEVSLVSDLTGNAGVSKVNLTWTDPEVNFSGLRVQYSAEGIDVTTVEVGKGEEELEVASLTAGKEYSFTVLIVADNGVVAEDGATVKATPKDTFKAPYIPEVIGAGTPSGWDGNGAMTKVSEYEWTYEFLSDGSDLDFKVRELGTWDNAFTNLEDDEISTGTTFHLRTGDNLPNIVMPIEGEGNVKITFSFENEDGVPEMLVEFTAAPLAPFSPRITFTGGSYDGDEHFMGLISQNEWSFTMDVTAGENLQFIIGNSDESTQYGDAADNTVESGTSFDASDYGDAAAGTSIDFTIPAVDGKVTIKFYFAGPAGNKAAPVIQLAYVAPSKITFQFRNFIGAANTSPSLVGDFTEDGWTHDVYVLNFDGDGNADVEVANQENLAKILFRVVVGGGDWSAPSGVDYVVLEPNAWNNLEDDHSYDSGDTNWGIGNDGEAKPAGGFVFGTNYTVTIDAAGNSRASLSIDGTTVWE
jgi:hypothetical protein